ncbi:LysR family transcriptional regulator, partial [Klebsiella pneumoniae]|uniref:LysR family transcriptional regulator n=1 Tax=Klebsiella pneumoniae TaxID=573 RepID=UPI003A5CABBF
MESREFQPGGRAARTASSAVSRGGQKLESKLGVSLLNQTTRQLSLTEEGEALFSPDAGGLAKWRRRERSAGDAHD